MLVGFNIVRTAEKKVRLEILQKSVGKFNTWMDDADLGIVNAFSKKCMAVFSDSCLAHLETKMLKNILWRRDCLASGYCSGTESWMIIGSYRVIFNPECLLDCLSCNDWGCFFWWNWSFTLANEGQCPELQKIENKINEKMSWCSSTLSYIALQLVIK